MLTAQDIKDISAKIDETVALARLKFGHTRFFQENTWEKPTFSIKLRGTTAGRAHLRLNHIKINPILFKENREKMLSQTIPHEIAHLVAYRVFNDTGHGKFWKHVMVQFGLKPDRCHSYDVSNARVRGRNTVTFKCKCKTWELTSIRANKHHKHMATKGRHFYTCRACGCGLQPADETTVNIVKKTITSLFPWNKP
jgi:SprT protein